MTRRATSSLACCAVLLVVGLSGGSALGEARTITSGGALADPLRVHAESPAPLSIERLTTRPRVAEVTLSPAGDRVAYRLREEVGASVWVREPRASALESVPRRLLQSELVDSIEWTSDGAGLFLFAADRIAHVAVDRPDPEPSWIVRLDEERDAKLLGLDPTRPHHLLVLEREDADRARATPDGAPWRLVRVDRDGRREVVHVSSTPIRRALFDRATGRLALVSRLDRDALETVLLAIDDEATERELLRCGAFDPCRPIALDGDRLLLKARLDGDRVALHEVDLGSGAVRRVLEDPRRRVELDEVVVDRSEGRARFAVFEADGHRVVALGRDDATALAVLGDRLGHRSIAVEPGDAAWLVTEHGPGIHHPRHHLFDPADGTLDPLLEAERRSGDPVPDDHLSTARFVEYRASDGVRLFGWLMLPAGAPIDGRLGDGRLGDHVPLVVQVHGGPWNHVRPGFSPLAQRLASRGVAVFAPNFRGSTGFGRTYLEAPQSDFQGDGRVMGDILDGVDLLAGRPLSEIRSALGTSDRLAPRETAADPGEAPRIAILGHSFGGYATLSALAYAPRRFAGGVASAPPVDLVRTVRRLQDDDDPTEPPRRRTVALLLDVDDPRIAQKLRARSPEAALDAIERPLLMMAGGVDDRVDVADVRAAALALQARGHDVSLAVDDAMGHSFDTERRARIYLELVDRFLGLHLDLPATALHATDAAWLDPLTADLEIVGPSVARILGDLSPAAAPDPRP